MGDIRCSQGFRALSRARAATGSNATGRGLRLAHLAHGCAALQGPHSRRRTGVVKPIGRRAGCTPFFDSTWTCCRKIPPPAANPQRRMRGGRRVWGVLSFGDFSLDKQRKDTRPLAGETLVSESDSSAGKKALPGPPLQSGRREKTTKIRRPKSSTPYPPRTTAATPSSHPARSAAAPPRRRTPGTARTASSRRGRGSARRGRPRPRG